MNTEELLDALRLRGARLQLLDGERLGVEPSSVLTDDLRAEIRARKDEIVRELRRANEPLESAPALEVRQQIGAVLIDSPRYGQVWVVLSQRLEWQLRAEESERPNPRPVLTTADLARLEGKSPPLVEAILNTLAAFPGARVLQ
jgi:hypothetical protein